MVTGTAKQPPLDRASLDSTALVGLLRSSLRRLERADGRVTQKQLAKELGKAEQTVSRWFRGDTTPSESDLEVLRRTLEWTNEEYTSLYHPVQPMAVEAFGVRSPFPELLPLVDDPDRLLLGGDDQRAGDVLMDGRRDPVRGLVDGWVGTEAAALVIRGLLRSSRDAIVTTGTGHGLTSAAARLLAGLRESAVLRRSLVLHASLEALTGAPYERLLQGAREFTARAHPLAGVGRWNPDRDWVHAEADRVAADWLGRAVDPYQVRGHLQRTFAEQVTRSMILQPWEQVLPARLHESILSLASIHRVPSAHSFGAEGRRLAEERAAGRRLLARLLGSGSLSEQTWQQVRLRAPRLDGRWTTELMADLHQVGVKVTVVWDLSPTPVGRFPVSQCEPEALTESYARAVRVVAEAMRAFTLAQPDQQVNNVILVPHEAVASVAEVYRGTGAEPPLQWDLGPLTVDELTRMWRLQYRELDEGGADTAEVLALATAGIPRDVPSAISTATMLAAAQLRRPGPVVVHRGPVVDPGDHRRLMDAATISTMVTNLIKAELGERPVHVDPDLLKLEFERALSGVIAQHPGEGDNR